MDSRRQIGADSTALYEDEGGTAVSGVSRAISYKTSEGRHVASIRDRVETFENKLLRLVSRFLGVSTTEGQQLVSWPQKAAEETTAETVDVMSELKSLTRSPTAKREAEKRAITAALGDDLPRDVRDKINQEIDTTDAPDPLAAFAMSAAGGGGDEEDVE